MKNLVILFLIISLQSCSSLSKSKTYGAIGSALLCGTLGAYLGKELSPNKKSESLNRIIGMSTGASICTVGGYYMGKSLYESDPHNIQYKPIEFKPKNIIIKMPQAVIEDY